MLTDIAIASINCAESVTGELRRLYYQSCLRIFLINRLLLFRRHHLLLFYLCLQYFSDRIENSWAVVTNKHGRTAMIAFCEDLGATPTSTLAIKETNLVIA